MVTRESTDRHGSAIKSALAGSGSVGGSLILSGFFTYLFLTLAARALGPERFGPVSVLWSVVMIVGPGLFLPIQQELARGLAVHRRDRQGRAVLRLGSQSAFALAILGVTTAVVVGPWMVRSIFDGRPFLMACLVLALLSYAVSFVCRGFFAGLGQFERFGSLVVVETLVRLGLALAFWGLGWNSADAFALAVAVAPLGSALLVTAGGRRLRLEGESTTSRREFARALGWLLLGSTGSAALANAGPLIVQYLTEPGGRGAGPFLAALLVARISLYLFQAVQASLLPNVSELISAGEFRRARHAVVQLCAVVSLLIVVATAGAYAVGPAVLRLMFGSQYMVSSLTMGLLALGTAVYILAMALAGPAIAVSAHRLNAVAWLAGCVGLTSGLLLSDDVFLRVEIGYVIGSAVAAGVLLVGLPRHLRDRSPS